MDKGISRRYLIFTIFTALIIIGILARYLSVMVLRKDIPSSGLAPRMLVERGPILDRNGRILAIQNRLDSVEAWIPYVSLPEETASLLSSTLNLDNQSLLEDFKTKTASLWIKRKITPQESEKIRALLEEGKLKGIYLRQEFGRTYPEKTLAAHVLGYTGIDNQGLAGIEYSMNDTLSPVAGESARGEVYGNQVFLTLDINLQYQAEELARKAYTEHRADSVMLMVMDAKTGDILAYVSYPSFDPNRFSISSELERQNRPASYAYEPGSVFKIFTLASFIELGGINPYTRVYCSGKYDAVSPPLNCLGIHGEITPAGIIKYSCNAGAAAVSESVDSQSFYQMLRNFGFGSSTLLPLPGESAGILRNSLSWSNRSKPTIAIGQEVSVSAVQMLTAATALANGGTLLKPHLVKKIVSPEGRVIQEFSREPVRQVISQETAQAMLLMMETSTQPGGTATRAGVKGVRVSSKTGTAEVIDKATGRYSKTAFVASCLSILPTEDPRIIVYTVLDNPKAGEYLGGRIAAPLAASLSEEAVSYLGIPRSSDIVVEHTGIIQIEKPPLVKIGETVPDFTGFSKRQILPLFAEEEIRVRITGEGWVVNQDPPAGTPVEPGMTINLELE